MARRPSGQEGGSENIGEYPGAAEPIPAEGGIIEYDPNAPPQAFEVTQATETADTLAVSADLLAAQEELEAQLAGTLAFAASADEETSDYVESGHRVIGSAIGFRFVDGYLTSDVTLKVYVSEPPTTNAQVSALAALPSEVRGVPVTTEVVGEIVPQSYKNRYVRPVRCGVSIGHLGVTAGTLGCLVQLNNGRLAILSNNHVIANSNNARRGDPIIQPGKLDNGQDPRDRIGVLENFVPINFPGPNTVDAAVAWTAFANVDPRHVTYVLNPNPVAPLLGMTVMKNGRTTQATIGTITDINATINVGYSGGIAQFRGQIGIRGIGGVFSRGGDSGSVIVTANSKQPVALLFAGRNDNTITFANPIGAVTSALGIRRFINSRA